MLLIDDIVKDFAEGVIAGIRENIKSKPVSEYGAVDTTGEAANSLFWRYTDGRLIIGSTWKYITVLEDGRRPGKGVSKEGQAKLIKWILEKPLPVKENSNLAGAPTAKGLAYLISMKLKESGSLIYQRGGKSGILSDYLNAEYIKDNLTEKVKEEVIKEARAALFR